MNSFQNKSESPPRCFCSCMIPKSTVLHSHMCCSFLICNLFLFSWIFNIPCIGCPSLCVGGIWEGKNFMTLIMEQGSVALKKKKKTSHLGEWGYKGDCYSAHGWKFKLIDINHIFLRLLFLFYSFENQLRCKSFSYYPIHDILYSIMRLHFCHMFSILH